MSEPSVDSSTLILNITMLLPRAFFEIALGERERYRERENEREGETERNGEEDRERESKVCLFSLKTLALSAGPEK